MTLEAETKSESPKRLSPKEIRVIAELIWEKYGAVAMMPNRAVPIVTGVMQELGCTPYQIETQRIEVSREILNVRRENT